MLDKLINYGEVHLKDPQRELRFLQRSNYLCFFVMFLVPIFIPIFLSVGVGWYSWLLLGVLANVILVYFINGKGYFFAGRLLQITSYTLWLLFYTWLFGEASGVQFLFIVFATFPFLIFSHQNLEIQLLAFGLLMLCFIVTNNGFLKGSGILADSNFEALKVIMELLTLVWLGANFYYLNLTTNAVERKLSEAVKRVERANKEMEEFVYIASHDLQEPLRTVQSFGSLLEEEASGFSPDQRTYMSFIQRSTQRMQNLIEALMKHTRLGLNKQKEVVNLDKLLQEVLEDISVLLKETGTRVYIKPLPMVVGLPTELRLLFQNLISNAIKFQVMGNQPEIRIYNDIFAEQKDRYTICVEDNGIGIKPEHIGKIFAMFRRLHSGDSYKGSGIGLAHCRKIIDLHEGDITVKSEPGKGSTFCFTLQKYESQ